MRVFQARFYGVEIRAGVGGVVLGGEWVRQTFGGGSADGFCVVSQGSRAHPRCRLRAPGHKTRERAAQQVNGESHANRLRLRDRLPRHGNRLRGDGDLHGARSPREVPVQRPHK